MNGEWVAITTVMLVASKVMVSMIGQLESRKTMGDRGARPMRCARSKTSMANAVCQVQDEYERVRTWRRWKNCLRES